MILTHPVPNEASTYSSAMMGMVRPQRGMTTSLPTSEVYLSSDGLTAIATSPSIVSGRVVATITLNV